MDRVRCAQCGEEHDLSDIEPSFDRPHAYFEIASKDRGARTWNTEGLCVLWEHEAEPRRHFIRALLAVPIRGEEDDICWGLWVEVDEASFELVHDRWEDPEQVSVPPFTGALANQLPGFPNTLGLKGTVQLVGPSSYPRFRLDPATKHPLEREQREGVLLERALEWRAAAFHR